MAKPEGAISKRDHTKANPKPMACTCTHAWQDAKYGRGRRLHNPRNNEKWACTVCGSVKG